MAEGLGQQQSGVIYILLLREPLLLDFRDAKRLISCACVVWEFVRVSF